jgi:CHAD domain-containing protein
LLGVAHLVTTRQRTELRTSDGRRLAEIDHDSVHGTVLPGIEERSLRNAAGREVHFSEVEVELAEGSSLEILHAVVEKLEGCGARASTGGSKLTAVLQLPERATAPAKRRQVPLMADVLQEQARSCLDALLGHDPAIRIGDSDPEHIHRARVATRRLRTVLRAFAPVLSAVPPDGPPPWLSEMSEDLKWFAGTLGAARDSDVRLGSLEIDCAALPSLDAPGGATLLRAARDQQAGSHAELLDAMTKDRYLHLLQALDALASGVGPGLGDVPIMFWPTLCRPAATVMPSLAEQQWRAVLKAVENLGDQPADDQLHRVRIRAKGLRYVAEVAAPVLRRPADCRAAKATARAATDLQDVLGELHDAVATEQWLREAAEAAARQPGRAKGDALVVTGVAAGQLIAAAQDRQRAQRSAWPAVWDRLDRKKLLNWMA